MIIRRDVYNDIEPYLLSPEAVIITGMRRTGKTTLLRFIYDRIDLDNKIFIDLENTLNQKYFDEEDYEKVKLNFEILGLDLSRQAYVFLDEIQFVGNLPQVVKYLYDHYQVKFFLTGSSSFYLRNLFSESLVGRKYVFELFPLNFREFLLLKGEKLVVPKKGQPVSKTIFHTFDRFYDEYLKFGGFPGVVEKSNVAEKKRALNDVFSSYFQLEVLQLGDFRKTDVIRDLILLLMQRIGSKIDIQKLASELSVSRPTIYEYLSFLEGTYFIHLIKPFSGSRDVEIRGAEKVYLCDSGLVNNTAQISQGPLFENNVFQILRPRGVVNYYQKKGGAEIDFIVNKKEAYEAKLSPSSRDLNTLGRISRELKLNDFKLVSRNYLEIENVCYGFNL